MKVHAPVLQHSEFDWIRTFMARHTGVSLNESKRTLVVSRLEKRLRHLGVDSYQDYFRLFDHPAHAEERQRAIDLLTTHETYFFREPKHFDFLSDKISAEWPSGKPFRAWSAASSTGEEAYSIAMSLSHRLRHAPFEVVASDIARDVVEKAQRGLYPLEAAEKIPSHHRQTHCLKGTDEYAGWMLLDRRLRDKVRFFQANLLALPQGIGEFDVIFLRNVMIYFDQPTKQAVVQALSQKLKPGGYLFISHSESLSGIESPLRAVAPSIYRLIGNRGQHG